MKKLLQLLIIVIFSQAAGCGYSEYIGDAEHIVTRPYGGGVITRLIFPTFKFESQSTRTFDVEGFRTHVNSYIKFTIHSPTEIHHESMSTEVEITLLDKNNSVIFTRKAPLNANYVRRNRQNVPEPSGDEWRAMYTYDESPTGVIEYGRTPRPTNQMKYKDMFYPKQKLSRLIVKIGDVSKEFHNLSISMELGSWRGH